MNSRNLLELIFVSTTWLILAVLTLRIQRLTSELDGFDVLEEDKNAANTFIPLP